MIYIKNKVEIETMKKAGQIAKGALTKAIEAVKPGIKTIELNHIALNFINQCNAKPSFYQYNGFPQHICISINDEVVHGIPGNRVIEDGDIVSIDCGAMFQGYHGDCADTTFAGTVSKDLVALVEKTRESFYVGIKKAVVNNRIGDISEAIQTFIEANGYTIVRDLQGHGIGAHLHEGPDVPNFGRAGKGAKLACGMTIAVEPMVNIGSMDVYLDKNDWTYKTIDKRCSAHYENTILITNEEPVILTKL
jgi:methionyl aminopeptidase